MTGNGSADASGDGSGTANVESFWEAYWHGEAIGDGGDADESLLAYRNVRPEDGDWVSACAAPGAEPHLARYASFDAYLDNADALATLPVTAVMIQAALTDLPTR